MSAAAGPSPAIGRIRSIKKPDLIASALREEIVTGLRTGSLSPGDPLASEQELLTRFGVSRPTLREAMRLLETDRLVEMQVGVNGGIRVHRPPPVAAARQMALQFFLADARIASLFGLLATLQGETARLAATRATTAELNELEHLVRDLEPVTNDPVAAVEVYLRVQAHLAMLAHDPVISVMYSVLDGIFFERSWGMARKWTTRSDTTELNKRALKSMLRLLKLLRTGQSIKAMEHWRAHHEMSNALYFNIVDPDTPIDLTSYW